MEQGKQGYVPHVPNQPQYTIEPKHLINFVPNYNGDPLTIYNYLNNARQWLLAVGGNTPQNVMLLLTKLEGRAAIIVSMINHSFNWEIIEATLKIECADNRELNTLLVELSNVKRKGSYKDLIFELKQKLFFIKSKLTDKHGPTQQNLIDEIMEPYINTAQNSLRNSLPYHDQIFVSNCNFNETVNKVLQLEAEGRFDNIKQKFSNYLPAPRVINQIQPQWNTPQYKPMQNINNYPFHSQQNNSQRQKLYNPQFNNNRPSNSHFHNKYPWSPNPNNVFQRPPHPQFQQYRPNYNNYQPQRPNNNTQKPEDVTMRTAPPLKPNQVNLGKGFVAKELYHVENTNDLQNNLNIPEDNYNYYYTDENSYIPEENYCSYDQKYDYNSESNYYVPEGNYYVTEEQQDFREGLDPSKIS